MKKKRNIGFTTVELIVTFSLISIIVIFLLEMILILKNIYVDSGLRTNLLTQQAILSEKINYDFRNKIVIIANKCGENCANFYFNDGTNKKLKYDRSDNTITYGNFKDTLLKGSSFGNIKLSAETLIAPSNDLKKYNGILTMNIPIYSDNFEAENFGINVIYQYNSYRSAISGLNIVDNENAEKVIYLAGSSEDISFKGMTYNDPGYYLYDTKTKNTVLNDSSVEKSGIVGDELNKVYTITYRYKDSHGNIISEVNRNITVIQSINDFKYNGDVQQYKVPVSGVYKLQLWGASGGGSDVMKGLGGYTEANYYLQKSNVLNIYVGGQGTKGTYNTNAIGGFNGGGNSGISEEYFAGSGGGASDIRLNSTNLDKRIIVAGGGAGGGSRNDSSYTCNGGAGGGTAGLQGKCSSNTYLGGAGTQSVGGSSASYTTNCTTQATSGTLGIGGNGSTYSYSTSKFAGGGGGGGYYGGGGGARYGGGGGGSGYCDANLINCSLHTGTDTFYSPNENIYEKGHNGNGYIRITLISITN